MMQVLEEKRKTQEIPSSVYNRFFFYLRDRIFMLFSFEADKYVQFHFRLCTKLRKVGTAGDSGSVTSI